MSKGSAVNQLLTELLRDILATIVTLPWTKSISVTLEKTSVAREQPVDCWTDLYEIKLSSAYLEDVWVGRSLQQQVMCAPYPGLPTLLSTANGIFTSLELISVVCSYAEAMPGHIPLKFDVSRIDNDLFTITFITDPVPYGVQYVCVVVPSS